MPADYTFTCWSCLQPTEMDHKIGRSEDCPHCAMDMRSCKNCEFYDPHAHNDCREPTAEYVGEKEKGNFCDFFAPSTKGRKAQAPQDAAKAKLEALFKKS